MWVSEEIRKAILQGLKDIDRTDVWYSDKHAKAMGKNGRTNRGNIH